MCLRRILGVTRLDKIRNSSKRQTFGIKNTITELVANKSLRYFGLVKRMSSTRNPNLVLGSQVHGHTPRGRPARLWEDYVTSHCLESGLGTLTEACRLCKDRKSLDLARHNGSEAITQSPMGVDGLRQGRS